MAKKRHAELEKQYPGFNDTLSAYERQALPPCPKCGSTDTATVSGAGVIGRTIALAASTRRFKLMTGAAPGSLYCNRCKAVWQGSGC